MDEKKPEQPYLKRIIKLAIALVTILVLTNPSIIPIFPQGVRDALYTAWSGLFGEISEISAIIQINWVSIFKLIVIILLMSIVYYGAKLVIGKIKPKTGKGKSILSMVNSVMMYAVTLVTVVWCLNAIGVNLSTIFASLGNP